MAVAFDTLKAATRLREEAGFEERQATVLVELFADRYGDRRTSPRVTTWQPCAVT